MRTQKCSTNFIWLFHDLRHLRINFEPSKVGDLFPFKVSPRDLSTDVSDYPCPCLHVDFVCNDIENLWPPFEEVLGELHILHTDGLETGDEMED